MKITKRQIPHPHPAENEIYITRKHPLKVYIKRAQTLIESGYTEVYVHGSGMAIAGALDLANSVKHLFETLEIETDSTYALDQVEDSQARIRPVPSIHILLKGTKAII